MSELFRLIIFQRILQRAWLRWWAKAKHFSSEGETERERERGHTERGFEGSKKWKHAWLLPPTSRSNSSSSSSSSNVEPSRAEREVMLEVGAPFRYTPARKVKKKKKKKNYIQAYALTYTHVIFQRPCVRLSSIPLFVSCGQTIDENCNLSVWE